MSLITFQEFCAIVASLSHHHGLQSKCLRWQVHITGPTARFSYYCIFTSPAPHIEVVKQIQFLSVELSNPASEHILKIISVCKPVTGGGTKEAHEVSSF